VLSSSSGLILVGSADAGRIRTFQLASRVGKMEHGHLSELTGPQTGCALKGAGSQRGEPARELVRSTR